MGQFLCCYIGNILASLFFVLIFIIVFTITFDLYICIIVNCDLFFDCVTFFIYCMFKSDFNLVFSLSHNDFAISYALSLLTSIGL